MQTRKAGDSDQGGRRCRTAQTVRYLQRSPQCRVVRTVPMADVPLTLASVMSSILEFGDTAARIDIGST